MSLSEKLFVAVVVICSPFVGLAENTVKTTQKIKLNQSLSKELTVEPVQVAPVQVSAPDSTLRERPFPKLDPVQVDPGFRLFPVMNDGKRIYVSLYGDGSKISSELEKAFAEAWGKSLSKDSFYVEGELARKALEELRINEGVSIYWFQFSQPKDNQVPSQKISKLLVKPNGAGDGVFGTVGVELELAAGSKSSPVAVGLAFIGRSNQLSPSGMQSLQWVPAQLNVPAEKIMELADYIAPRGETGVREIKQPLEFQMVRLGDVELIQGTAQFDRKEFSEQEGFTETMYGYFLKGRTTRALYDFYLDTTYYQKPERILIGRWVKGFDASLYISSTGMGDCGRFVLVKRGVEPLAVPVRCGAWGC